MGIEREGSEMMRAAERAQAVASYARAFFRSMDPDEFCRLIERARSSGQQWLVERLYSGKVIDNVVRAILRRIDKGHSVDDQLDDYVQDATVVLMQIARQQKLDLTRTAGEIASYVCLWIEQRVKRMARKDQRWRFSLSESVDDVEGSAESAGTEHMGQAAWNVAQSAGQSAGDQGIEAERIAEPWRRSIRKSERNVLSIFGF